MKTTIEITKVNKYGNILIYPVCDTAKQFCKLLGGQKTLTENNISHIKSIGFGVHHLVEVNGKYLKVGEL